MEVNIWKKFVGLIPGGVRVIGTVTGVNLAQGISTVRLRNGSSFAARGVSVPAGSNAIVIDGNVVSSAPDLPQYDVEV